VSLLTASMADMSTIRDSLKRSKNNTFKKQKEEPRLERGFWLNMQGSGEAVRARTKVWAPRCGHLKIMRLKTSGSSHKWCP
jgi:hypothetical protein